MKKNRCIATESAGTGTNHGKIEMRWRFNQGVGRRGGRHVPTFRLQNTTIGTKLRRGSLTPTLLRRTQWQTDQRQFPGSTLLSDVRDTSTGLASMAWDVMSETENVPAPRTSGLLQEGTEGRRHHHHPVTTGHAMCSPFSYQ
jgi:hypothetical protein